MASHVESGTEHDPAEPKDDTLPESSPAVPAGAGGEGSASRSTHRWWVPWLASAALLTIAVAMPSIQPSLGAVQRQMQAQRCRDQMMALVDGEIQHYLDHRSFTTEQDALARYVPYAESARCPTCGARYVLEVTKKDVYVRCACGEADHGWVHAEAPSFPDSLAPAPLP